LARGERGRCAYLYHCSWSARQIHSQEGFLLGALTIHVYVFKEAGNAIVAQDFAVENIDSGFNGGLSSELVKKR
jgi:hypothetical protein